MFRRRSFRREHWRNERTVESDWCWTERSERRGDRQWSQKKHMNLYSNLLYGLATGHGARIHLAGAVAFVAAVHRSVFVLLCIALLRRMVISVDRTVVSSAARTGNSHQSGGCHRRINKQQRDKTGNCRHAFLQPLPGCLQAENSHMGITMILHFRAKPSSLRRAVGANRQGLPTCGGRARNDGVMQSMYVWRQNLTRLFQMGPLRVDRFSGGGVDLAVQGRQTRWHGTHIHEL